MVGARGFEPPAPASRKNTPLLVPLALTSDETDSGFWSQFGHAKDEEYSEACEIGVLSIPYKFYS